MKKAKVILLTLITIVFIGSCGNPQSTDQGDAGEDKVILFNGSDLNNWAFHLADSLVDPSSVFTVRDGVIHIAGDPFGYMRTKDQYSDYTLHVEWRWPKEASNSGIFVHTQLPDTIWPQCFECQLMAGNAGDFVCMSGTAMAEKTESIVVAKSLESNEKAVGEWNAMEITCVADSLEVVVNGLLQNKGTQLSITQGSICLQSEGKDIEFRNIYLIRL